MKKLVLSALCLLAFVAVSVTTVSAEEGTAAPTIKCKVGSEVKDVKDEKACTDLGGSVEKAE